MSEKILESFVEVLPILKILTQEDMDAIVTDTAKVVAYVPGEKTRMPVVVGRELNPKQASDSTQKISRELSDIKKTVTDIISDIQGIGDITASQASATEEITAALQEITSTFETLVESTKVV